MKDTQLTKNKPKLESAASGNTSGELAQKLVASEERFQSVVQTATDAIILWDEGGNILFWNKGAQTMFGYAEAEVVGKPLTLLIPVRYHEAHHYGMGRVGTEGEEGRTTVKTVELHGLRKNGDEFPIEMAPSKSILEGETFFCGIIRDISERKQADQVLEERNRLLAFEVEVGHVLNRSQALGALWQGCVDAMVRHLGAALAGIWTLDSQQEGLELQASAGLYIHVTGAQGPMPFGHIQIGQIAFQKRPYLTNAIPEDPGVPEQAWAKKEGLVAFAGYPLLINREVAGVMAMYFRHPLTNFTWHSLGLVADRIATAIERQKVIDANQRLARHNERILASSGEGMLGLDGEGKMTFVNPAGAQMLGYKREEMVGESMHELIHHTNSDGSPCLRESCPIYAALKEGSVHQNDTEVFWRKDGASFPVDHYISPIWENGSLIGAVVTFKDISERKRLTAELLEETKLASVTVMLGDIAHDIKNMLMPVLNGAKLLDDDLQELFTSVPDVTPKQVTASRKFSREAIDMIVNNARRIQGRMREIADTVKGISSPLRFAPCRISDVVKGVFDILRFYATEKGVSLQAQGLDDLPSIHADENRVFNALYNLVNNAIPETPAGGSVTIGGSVGSDKKTVILTVTDTGGGMPPEIRDRLFTKEAISGKAGGTGLGTKIVKDAVDAHSGTITVRSEPGTGSIFTIHLPITPQILEP
jgi:PAS domain S-box-containing protein